MGGECLPPEKAHATTQMKFCFSPNDCFVNILLTNVFFSAEDSSTPSFTGEIFAVSPTSKNL